MVSVLVMVVGNVISDVNGTCVVTVVETLVKYVFVNDENTVRDVVNTEPPDVNVLATIVVVRPVLVLVTSAFVVRVVRRLLKRVVIVVNEEVVSVVTIIPGQLSVLVKVVVTGAYEVSVVDTFVGYVFVKVDVISTLVVIDEPPDTLNDVNVVGTKLV